MKEHTDGVIKFAGSFSIEMCRDVVEASAAAHDIGKYAEAFQERLEGSEKRFEHSACGAIAYNELLQNPNDELIVRMIQYCVAGHHTGLPDGGCKADGAYEDVTLNSRLKREYCGESDYSAYRKEVKLVIPQWESILLELQRCRSKTECIELFAFLTRYVFSCLTDADFLDTERFCNPDVQRGLSADFLSAERAVNHWMGAFQADTPLQAARSRLQHQAYENASGAAQIGILNMPTGSGKTLCSLKIALDKVCASKDKKRIIYVIPYTSIIEQTAGLFQQIFGEFADILQHHSNYCFDDADDENSKTSEKLKRSAENWDAPVIITTSVQFFQSLYHYRGSGLRKLHNMADSIIVFDEIHLLPVGLLQPCLRGIGYVTKYLNSEAIFLSATMPDYTGLFQKYLPDVPVHELITDKTDFRYFEKCRFINLGKTDNESVVEKAGSYNSSLIIVNSRKSAREIYNMISGNKYHLSTYMTPVDRSSVIAEIHNDLKNHKKITVVSTSLVEAGVDFDFEAVFRQLAGLDNILQSAGRCNREGRNTCGNVFIFETEDEPQGEMKVRANIAKGLFKEFSDISSTECIRAYYSRLFSFAADKINRETIAEGVTGWDNIPFRTYAEQFEFIKEDTIGVVIDDSSRGEIKELLCRLEHGDYSVKRKLQQYSVSLRRHSEFGSALDMGLLSEKNGVYVLSDSSYYNNRTGLDLTMHHDIILSNGKEW